MFISVTTTKSGDVCLMSQYIKMWTPIGGEASLNEIFHNTWKWARQFFIKILKHFNHGQENIQ